MRSASRTCSIAVHVPVINSPVPMSLTHGMSVWRERRGYSYDESESVGMVESG